MLDYKYSLILGGFFGFLLTFSVSYLTGGNITDALKDASIGCVVGAVLMKVFLFILELAIKSLQFDRENESRIIL